MCGIVGIFNLNGASVNSELLFEAANVQKHRGPDDEGYLLVNTRSGSTVTCAGPDTDPRLSLPPLNLFRGEHFDLAFGFRRLSIHDLSSSGHQPMSRSNGRYWIVFSGEIYNYLELRSELISKGLRFHTECDTEVLLAAYEHWGEACLDHFNGMFAFAIWDTTDKTLFLARDRFGEKPLHYVYVPGKLFAFASEMKALWAAGVVERKIHEETLALYKYYNQVEGTEQTFYDGILRLPQAHSLRLTYEGSLHKRRYWDIDPRLKDDSKGDLYYAERFRELFTESVKLRLRSDVPVGSSLSGGLDSSTVVSVVDSLRNASRSQKTFSARFDDPVLDEGKWMKLVTATSRSEAHEVWPTGKGLFEEMTRLFWHQEEPFTSTSIYAQWSVMRLAKQHGVSVLLDGQGADEMMAGYHSYFDVIADDLMKSLNLHAFLNLRKKCWRLHGVAPGSVKRVLIQGMPRGLKETVKSLRHRIRCVADLHPVVPRYPAEFKNVSGLRKLLWWNTTRQGLAELLRYAERNSMAHGREVRMPFLDHRLVEFVFTLPEHCLHRRASTKWILRESFRGVLPEKIIDRIDKIGYMPPEKAWLGTRVWKDIMIKQLAVGSDATPVVTEPLVKTAAV